MQIEAVLGLVYLATLAVLVGGLVQGRGRFDGLPAAGTLLVGLASAVALAVIACL